MIKYLSKEDLDLVVELLSTLYSKIEEVPEYKFEKQGFEKLCGILEQSQSDTYYPTIFQKASFVLVGINKGHFFSNGNKRLALVTVATFLDNNKFVLKRDTKEYYKKFLTSLFPEYNLWADFDEFSSTDFATYNLSIMIADSGVYNITHDELKRRVTVFLEEATEGI